MDLETEILLLPSNKSHGLYSCPVLVLNFSSNYILSQPLAQKMNISIITGHYLSKLKPAKIVPIFKDGDETGPFLFFHFSIGSLRKLCAID